MSVDSRDSVLARENFLAYDEYLASAWTPPSWRRDSPDRDADSVVTTEPAESEGRGGALGGMLTIFWLELQYNRSADCHAEIGINCSAPQPGTSEELGEFLGSTETRVQKYRHEDYARARTTTITRVTEVRAKRARGPPPPQCGRCNCCEGWRMVAEYLRNNVTDARVLGLIPRMPDRYMDGEEGVAEEIIVVD